MVPWWLKTNSHGGKVTKFHADNYEADFPYRDFAPDVRAEMFDPAEWANIFKRSGAEYMVITSKHHDGYCLWDARSPASPRVPVELGRDRAKQDLIADLFEACRAEGVRPSLYYSFLEWDNLYDREDKSEYVDRLMIPQIKELIETYEPAVFWPDGVGPSRHDVAEPEILEWIYERREPRGNRGERSVGAWASRAGRRLHDHRVRQSRELRRQGDAEAPAVRGVAASVIPSRSTGRELRPLRLADRVRAATDRPGESRWRAAPRHRPNRRRADPAHHGRSPDRDRRLARDQRRGDQGRGSPLVASVGSGDDEGRHALPARFRLAEDDRLVVPGL